LLLPMQAFVAMSQGFDQSPGDFTERMRALYGGLLEPLRSRDPAFAKHMRLHFRELLEPTGATQELLEIAFMPFFKRVAQLVSRELNTKDLDDDCYRLTFAMIGMAMDFYTSQDCSSVLAPNIVSTPDQVSLLIERLAGYATGMLIFERDRINKINQHNQSLAQERP
jgi:TetR/AcrR family transcriptional regulator, regulator of cefoperazone and chloramphenicol sensitivity